LDAISFSALAASLTQGDAFDSLARVKWLLLCLVALVGSSCTTLENRRDLYRAPEEGYEQNYPEPPPTRLPSLPPEAPGARTTTHTEHGVITYPEESLPEGRR